jgi:hypothetical protein
VLSPEHANGEPQPQPASVSSSSFDRRRGISWDNYLVAVEKYPIRTKCFTAWIIFVAADAFAQSVEYILYKNHSMILVIDWIRAMRFGALGLFGAPWSHYYFHWLDHYLPPSEEPFTKRTALKVCIDQFIQAPILLAIMIFSLSLMKGQGFTGALQDLSNTFMVSLIANCTRSKTMPWCFASFGRFPFFCCISHLIRLLCFSFSRAFLQSIQKGNFGYPLLL